MKQLLAILILIPLIFSCTIGNDEPVAGDCAGNQICTEVYMSIALEIKDQQGNPYSLDEYYTTKVATGQKIVLNSVAELEYQQKYGMYPVLDDGQIDNTTKAGQDFEFTGKKNGKVVVTKILTIGHDCCHIVLKKGETKVIVAE